MTLTYKTIAHFFFVLKINYNRRCKVKSKPFLVKHYKVFWLIDPPANVGSTWPFPCMYHIYIFVLLRSRTVYFKLPLHKPNFTAILCL